MSAMALELEEKKRQEVQIAFSRRKWEEQPCLKSLCTEEVAAVAVAQAKAIDDQLGLAHEYQLPDLLVKGPCKCVEEFINSQLWETEPQDRPRGPWFSF